MKKIFLIVSCLSILAVSCISEKAIEQPAIEITNPTKLDSVLNHYVDAGHYPFLYARLENWDGKVLYEHGVTNHELYPELQVTGDTWFRIWSMSKIITISVALDLIEDGILSMNDPVTKYIPEFADLKVATTEEGKPLTDFEWGQGAAACPIKYVNLESEMTVSDLINHKAGFYYALTSIPCLDTLIAQQDLPTAQNPDEFIKKVAQLPLIQQPGYTYHYGINTTILGFVAERATGKSLKELVEERVTNPMQIPGLQYGLPPGVELLPRTSGKDSILRIAHDGELDIFGQNVPDYFPEHALYLGGEGMLGTADGYADFARMLLQKGELGDYRFLDEETIKDLSSPHTQLENPWGYNGYNLWITGDTMRTLGYGDAGLWTGGGYEGTHFWIDTQRKFVGVVMTQISFPNLSAKPGISDAFRGALYQEFWKNEK